MMRQVVVIAGMLLLGVAHALGEPYEVAYYAPECEACAAAEGLPGPFPEDQGWPRSFGSGGADRSIQGGALVLATNPEDITVFDSYKIDMGGNLDPVPGEVFFAEWLMRVDANSSETSGDSGITIARDSTGGAFGGGDISFRFLINRVIERHTPGEALFEEGVSHVFRVESKDMENFKFYIDGELGMAGVFDSPSTNMSFVGWGDNVDGISSTCRWGYVRFGVATLGDINLDGRIDLNDFAIFATCFGAPLSSPPLSCSDQEASLSDLNGDELIDLIDFATFAAKFTG